MNFRTLHLSLDRLSGLLATTDDLEAPVILNVNGSEYPLETVEMETDSNGDSRVILSDVTID